MEPVRMAKVQPEEAGADANPAATIKWTKESAPVAAREKVPVAARAGGIENNL